MTDRIFILFYLYYWLPKYIKKRNITLFIAIDVVGCRNKKSDYDAFMFTLYCVSKCVNTLEYFQHNYVKTISMSIHYITIILYS